LTREPNVTYIGRKPTMSYVLAVMTSFSGFDAKEVTLKARGQAITTAVDVAEITRRRFMKELNISKITIGTEEMPPREGAAERRRKQKQERINNRNHLKQGNQAKRISIVMKKCERSEDAYES